MSQNTLIKIKCPGCGKNFNTCYWKSINVSVNPLLKKLFLHDMINRAVCPYCGVEVHVPGQFIYHDMENKVLFVVMEKGYSRAKCKAILKDFHRIEKLFIENNLASRKELDTYLSAPVFVKSCGELKERVKEVDTSFPRDIDVIIWLGSDFGDSQGTSRFGRNDPVICNYEIRNLSETSVWINAANRVDIKEVPDELHEVTVNLSADDSTDLYYRGLVEYSSVTKSDFIPLAYDAYIRGSFDISFFYWINHPGRFTLDISYNSIDIRKVLKNTSVNEQLWSGKAVSNTVHFIIDECANIVESGDREKNERNASSDCRDEEWIKEIPVSNHNLVGYVLPHATKEPRVFVSDMITDVSRRDMIKSYLDEAALLMEQNPPFDRILDRNNIAKFAIESVMKKKDILKLTSQMRDFFVHRYKAYSESRLQK